jgi:hypothetical protein
MDRTKPQPLLVRILFIALASVVGTEFLTGSTPVIPPAWLSRTFLIVIVLYGSGVLLIREVAVIWKKGWLSILSFGAAYAIIEEGIVAKTWFADMPITYGKWHGINWSFGLAETIVEAIFSIAIPIALSRIAFPGSESERWFGNKSLTLIGSIYLLIVAIGSLAPIHQYTQPIIQLPLALFMIAVLICIGFSVGSPTIPVPPKGVLASPRILTAIYFGSTLVIFLLAPLWMTPRTPHPLPPFLAAVLAITAVILIFRFLHRTSLSARQLFAVVIGITSVMLIWSIFGPQNKRGAPLGALMYLALLAFAWRGKAHLKKRLQ